MGSESDALGLIGTTIADKYAVESVVGEGGFAVVYRAMHVLWRRPVAVKVFKALGEVAQHERKKLLDDFIQEGALLADLSERSTAICQARDVGMLTTSRNEHVPYMVLEWLEGRPLEGVLEAERLAAVPLRSLEQTIRLLDPIAEALALAHKKGIVHRDVKPANVFVLGDPRGSDVSVKLLDFGIAKVVQDAQKMGFGKTAGHITSFTPSYGAPEQFNRAYGATGPWTDVFALALVTVETLTGREPLSGDTLVQLAYAASDPTVRPTPRTYGATTSDEVDAVFVKAMAVKPDDRYQNAGEFWNALRNVAVGHAVVAVGSVQSAPAMSVASTADTVLRVSAVGATAVAPPSGPSPHSAAAAEASSQVAAGGERSPKPKSQGLVIGAVLGVIVIAGGVGAIMIKGGKSSANGADPVTNERATSGLASGSQAVVPQEKACPPGMKRIPGGEYFMGSDEKDAEANEKPPHKVKLAAYCLDELEVTVARYKACSDRGGCLRAGRENDWENITPLQHEIYDPLCNIVDPVGRAQHPINCVSWEQAKRYCEAEDARLPTEAEWEFAARGSDGRIYPWGDGKPSAELLNACGKECVAWMKKNPDPDQPIASMFQEDDGFANTAPVGSFPKGKSSWGIHDIAGNVWEWVADWYAAYDPASANTTTTDPKGPSNGAERVIRGGAWNGAQPSWVRPAWRFHAAATNRTHGTGFRCAKSL
jgi:formylglycine-generating enzyme required for sulfatase activity/serine/threonine protein kinase